MGPKIVKSFPKWTIIIVYDKILLFVDCLVKDIVL